MQSSQLTTSLLALLFVSSIGIGFLLEGDARQEKNSQQAEKKNQRTKKVGHPSLMSPHSDPIALFKDRLFIANTPSDTVDVININTGEIVKRIGV